MCWERENVSEWGKLWANGVEMGEKGLGLGNQGYTKLSHPLPSVLPPACFAQRRYFRDQSTPGTLSSCCPSWERLLCLTWLAGAALGPQAAARLGVVGPSRTWELSCRGSACRAVVPRGTCILQDGRGILGAEEPEPKRK